MLDLFLTFLKIGTVSFGGGYGMISVLSEEVIKHGWLTEQQLLSFIAVSESTPGPVAINMATFIGASQGGAIIGGVFGSLLGAILATFAVVLPAFIIILIIAALIRGVLKYAGVQAVLAGIRPVVIGLIIGTALNLFVSVIIGVSKVTDAPNFDWRALTIFGLIVAVYFSSSLIFKKKISPILLIVISAFLGIVFYGFLAFL